jgi:hypothetical protein
VTSPPTYNAVRACAVALLAGAVLNCAGVTAGCGLVIDWRTVKSGETLQAGADAFDTARLFVSLVGDDLALTCAGGDAPEPPPVPAMPVRISAYMPNHDGARRRSFDVGPYRVYVEPHEDDAAQAAFTARLALFAAGAAS